MPPNVSANCLVFLLRQRLAWLLLLLGSLLATPLQAQDLFASAVTVERKSEAVQQVVLGILGYVRWPVEPAEVRLCVIGPTEYADDMLHGMVQGNGRPVRVQRRDAFDANIGNVCHAVYLGSVTDLERQKVFGALVGRPTLSISERDPTCSVGSMFCLKIGVPRVTFEVNLDSVARSGVRVHPSVLQFGKRQAKP